MIGDILYSEIIRVKPKTLMSQSLPSLLRLKSVFSVWSVSRDADLFRNHQANTDSFAVQQNNTALLRTNEISGISNRASNQIKSNHVYCQKHKDSYTYRL